MLFLCDKWFVIPNHIFPVPRIDGLMQERRNSIAVTSFLHQPIEMLVLLCMLCYHWDYFPSVFSGGMSLGMLGHFLQPCVQGWLAKMHFYMWYTYIHLYFSHIWHNLYQHFFLSTVITWLKHTNNFKIEILLKYCGFSGTLLLLQLFLRGVVQHIDITQYTK